MKSSYLGFLWNRDDGGAFEVGRDFTQLQRSIKDLCEDGGPASLHRFSDRLVSCLLLFFLKTWQHIFFADLKYSSGGEGGCWRC